MFESVETRLRAMTFPRSVMYVQLAGACRNKCCRDLRSTFPGQRSIRCSADGGVSAVRTWEPDSWIPSASIGKAIRVFRSWCWMNMRGNVTQRCRRAGPAWSDCHQRLLRDPENTAKVFRTTQFSRRNAGVQRRIALSGEEGYLYFVARRDE